MDRLTISGFDYDRDFIASHLQSWSIAQAVKRLAAYEDSDMMPDEIAALKADRDRWKDRAEEAEVDIHDMLYEARLLMDDALCVWCNKFSVAYNLCLAQEQDCKSECKWRGAEGGGE